MTWILQLKIISIVFFNCSDAHQLEEIGKHYTWIKANPSFWGLKQAICDNSRVSKSNIEPDIKENYFVISEILLKDKNNKWFLNNKKICLNRNLKYYSWW